MMDNQFKTIDIISYLDDHQVQYQLAPPFEHEYIGRIERNNRTAQVNSHVLSSAKNKKNYGYSSCIK